MNQVLRFAPGLLIGVALFLFSCDQFKSKTGESDAAEEAPAEIIPTAISLWNSVGLRDAPGNKAKYVTNIFFGERVTLTGNRQEIPEEKRTYLEVTLSDGKSGWVNEFLLMENGELGAVVAPLSVYRRPDITTVMPTSFVAGQLVAFTETDNPEWIQVSGLEKKVTGYVRLGDALSTEEGDVQVAVLLARAAAEKDPNKQLALLQSISSNPAFESSALLAVAETTTTQLSDKLALPSNQLYITGDKVNIRSLPATEGSEVVFQLASGVICNILEKGEAATIAGKEDYWYQIDHDGQTGWVFGAFTSKAVVK